MPGDLQSVLHFSPSEDPRFGMSARMWAPPPPAPEFMRKRGGSQRSGRGRREAAEAPGLSEPRDAGASVTLRFEPDPSMPYTFADLKARARVGAPASAELRVVKAPPPEGGAGAWACLPVGGGGSGAPAGPGGAARAPEGALDKGAAPAFETSPVHGPSYYRPASSVAEEAAVGVRWSSPGLGAGVEVRPGSTTLSRAWLVGRAGPVLWGVSTAPELALRDVFGGAWVGGLGFRREQPAPGGADDAPGEGPGDLARSSVGEGGAAAPLAGAAPSSASLSAAGGALLRASSFAVAYSPGYVARASRAGSVSGQTFTAAVEASRDGTLTVSVLHHSAIQRRVGNPLESRDVAGITNYVDLGFQLAADLRGGGDPSVRAGGSWQINKNVLVKARLGLDAAGVAVVTRAWSQPSVTFAASATYDLRTGHTAAGVLLSLETWRAPRYERAGREAMVVGGQLTQRHVASTADLALRDAQGRLVEVKDAHAVSTLNLQNAAQDVCL